MVRERRPSKSIKENSQEEVKEELENESHSKKIIGNLDVRMYLRCLGGTGDLEG